MTTTPAFRSRLSPAVPVLALVAALAAPLVVPVGARTTPAQSAPAAELFKDLRWRNLGPANMAGPRHATSKPSKRIRRSSSSARRRAASGNRSNAGTTWEPIFTNYGTSSIGDIAIFQKDPNIVWVGTGEELRAQQRVVGRRRLQVHRRRRDVRQRRAEGDASHRPRRSRIRRIRTSSTSRRRDISGATTASAGSSRRSTAARRGGSSPSGLPNDDRTGASDDPDGSVESQHSVRRHVGAHPPAVHLRERRPERRHLQVHERRRDVDEARRRVCRPAGSARSTLTIHRKNPQDPVGDRRSAAQRRISRCRAPASIDPRTPARRGRS